jgi:DNA-binding transcriptional regulator YhcF (GntR family)
MSAEGMSRRVTHERDTLPSNSPPFRFSRLTGVGSAPRDRCSHPQPLTTRLPYVHSCTPSASDTVWPAHDGVMNAPSDQVPATHPAQGAPVDRDAAATVDLGPLRLPSDAALALRLLLDGRPRSQAVIARELGLNRMAVSRSVRHLEEAGFVHSDGRKPSTITCALLPPIVQALADTVERQSYERVLRLRRLADAVHGMGVAQQRGHHWLLPQGLHEAISARELAWGRRWVDLIVADGARPTFVPLAGPTYAARVAVRRRTLFSANARVPVPGLAGEARHSSASLPGLRVVDGVRGAIEVSIRGTSRQAWTDDRVEVNALHRLFQLLWEEAEVLSADGAREPVPGTP